MKLRLGAVPNTDPATGEYRQPTKRTDPAGCNSSGLRKNGPSRARRRDLGYIDELVSENERLLSREFSRL